jgi:predicted Zn finger-like uncharacterized protein
MYNKAARRCCETGAKGLKMRLICPNCGAQYEVADDVIPQDGRDVQCSNCGHTWFEQRGASDVEDEFFDTPVEIPVQSDDDISQNWTEEEAPAAKAAAPKRQELDPAIADILREEAAREADARAREESAFETQPDLGLDQAQAAPDQRTQETQRRMASLKGEDISATLETAAASRRELLPDIEEINSSLRSDAERTPAPDTPKEISKAKSRKSFRSGFFGVLLVLAILTAIYVFAPQISDMMPALAPSLNSYVETVDALRLWIDLKLQSMVNTMNTDG